mmetsp:Transcript_19298/g.35368  ORF Transcript_19298/g.35368 Transcript_19298/m.35368 type:complete len:787 (-) Transcript_19298:190-2550(-)
MTRQAKENQTDERPSFVALPSSHEIDDTHMECDCNNSDACKPRLLLIRLMMGSAALIVSGAVGAAIATGYHNSAIKMMEDGISPTLTASSTKSIQFSYSRASEVLGELSVAELQAVSSWFMQKTGTASSQCAADAQIKKKWLSGPSAVELLRPPKSETVAYLDNRGPRPARFARVVVASMKDVIEYQVGPLGSGGVPTAEATIMQLVPSDSIPFAQRPDTDCNFPDLLWSKVVREVGAHLLVSAFGQIWPDLVDEGGFVPGKGTASFQGRNEVLAPAGMRKLRFKGQYVPPKPSRPTAKYLYPLPFDFDVNATSVEISDWTVSNFSFCGQGPFESVSALLEAYGKGKLDICQPTFSHVGNWDTPEIETRASPLGREKRNNSGVSWGPWSFSVTQRPSTGIAITDVRFNGERIAYELALADAAAIYTGTLHDQFMYSDSAFSLSQMSSSLEPGVDCPIDAKYLSAANWMGPNDGRDPDPSKAYEFWPICVFEWTEDHTIWRHMDNSQTRGLLRKTVVVRSIASIVNYDYIMEFKFREDGEISVQSRFSGYPETRYASRGEERFSTIVRPGVAGIQHTHSIAFKADLDVASGKNALRITESREHVSDSAPRYPTRILQHHYVEQEGSGESTFVADPRSPKVWAIVDRNSSSTHGGHGNPRGYRIELTSFASTQVLLASNPFVKAAPWTKYHLAVTKYRDSEYRPASPYTNFDGLEPWVGEGAQNLDKFLANGEQLLDEDLVAWIGLCREHIVRQEDLPVVSNFGVSFSLQPWNFHSNNIASNPRSAEL